MPVLSTTSGVADVQRSVLQIDNIEGPDESNLSLSWAIRYATSIRFLPAYLSSDDSMAVTILTHLYEEREFEFERKTEWGRTRAGSDNDFTAQSILNIYRTD